MKCNRNKPFFQSQNQTPKEKMKEWTQTACFLWLDCIVSVLAFALWAERLPTLPSLLYNSEEGIQ